jgi:hypothetical protein
MMFIKYKYNSVKSKATLESYKEDGHEYYRVTLPDGLQFSITPAENLTAEGRMTWKQSNTGGGVVQSHDFVQFVGGRIEDKIKGPDYKKISLQIAFVLFALGVILWAVANNIMLPISGKCHTAIITNQKISHAGGKHPTRYTLAYEFWVDGKKYTGDTGEDEMWKYRIGENICIVYLNYFPRTNEPVNYFFRGEINCACNN